MPASVRSGEPTVFERRGHVLWEARPARAALLMLQAPKAVFLTVFVGILFAFGLRSEALSQATLFIADHRVPLDPATARWLGTLLIGIFCVLAPAALVLPVWRAWRTRYRLTATIVETCLNDESVFLAVSAIQSVTVEAVLAWYKIAIEPRAGASLDLLLAKDDVWRLIRAFEQIGVAADAGDLPNPSPDLVILAPGEQVRWRGRPGLGAFDRMRAMAILGGSLPAIAFLLWLHAIWTPGTHLVVALMLSLFAFMLIGIMALGLAASGAPYLRDWWFDAAGLLLVTDRRIAWCAPWSGRIYRELAFADLVTVAVVERNGGRAWVALTVCKADDVETIDLHGVPDPDAFVAAAQRGA